MEEEITLLEKMKPAEPKQDALANSMVKCTVADWRVAETSRSLGYNGLSKRKRQDDAKKAMDRDKANESIRNSSVPLFKLI